MEEKPDRGEMPFPAICMEPVLWGYAREHHQANRYKAIVDATTGKLFSIVSTDYRLIRHEEAIGRIEQAINDVPDLDKYETYTRFYNNGGRMRRTYRFPDISVQIEEGDKVNPELHLFNSYDVTWPFIILLGAFRFICANGLVVGTKFLYIRKRHILTLEQIDPKEQVATALKRFNRQTRTWGKWSERQLTEKEYSQVMKSMKFGKNARKDIRGRIKHEVARTADNHLPAMSVWIFFNVLTWYITHRAVSLNHKVEMEKRLRKAMRHFKG